jgi:dTDP-4-dehydrorhamnose 3,5-epimerase-like enzyme
MQPFTGQAAPNEKLVTFKIRSLAWNMEIERVQLQMHGDNRGMLIALEKDRNVPFEIRRVYYLFSTKCDVHRGMHAHRNLNQLAVSVRGSVTFLLDDGEGPRKVVLNDPSQGLLLRRMVWREMYDFSEDCVLMVLADQFYDPADYITDYDAFMREVRGDTYMGDVPACQGR